MQTVSGWPLPAHHYRVMLTGGRTMPSDSLRFQAVPSDSLRVNPLRSNLLLLCQPALRTLRIQFSCIRSIVHAKRCGLTGDHTRHLTLFLLSSYSLLASSTGKNRCEPISSLSLASHSNWYNVLWPRIQIFVLHLTLSLLKLFFSCSGLSVASAALISPILELPLCSTVSIIQSIGDLSANLHSEPSQRTFTDEPLGLNRGYHEALKQRLDGRL